MRTNEDPARPGNYRLALNLSLVFTELPLTERFAAAAEQGFSGVEMQFPYDIPAGELAAAARAANTEVALINVPAGDLMSGGAGIASRPGREADYAEALDRCAEYVLALRPNCVNVLAGRGTTGAARQACLETLRTNLLRTCERFAPLGVTTVFEAINTLDSPGFLIDGTSMQCELMDELGHPDLRLQYDVYHMSRMGEDVTGFLREHGARVGHIQFADAPGRGEPGTGDIDFTALIAVLDDINYAGWLAAEYRPARSSAESFDWLHQPPFRGVRDRSGG